MSAIATAEPYKLSAGALALLVHAIFFSLLYFSFSWQTQTPQGMVVDIWDSLPSEPEVQAPAPVPAPVPPPIQAVKPVQLPPPPPKVEPAPLSPPKADIELRDKKKKLKEEKERLEKAKEEKERLEKAEARQQAEKRAEQAERRMEEAERQAQARSQSQAQSQRKAQAEAVAASGKVVDEYIAKIAAKIRRYIVLPPGVSPNIKAEFNVTLLPGGEVLTANLAKSSGNDAYDSAVERAILKAQPLPLPPAEQNMFSRFRDLRLKFSPAESGK